MKNIILTQTHPNNLKVTRGCKPKDKQLVGHLFPTCLWGLATLVVVVKMAKQPEQKPNLEIESVCSSIKSPTLSVRL